METELALQSATPLATRLATQLANKQALVLTNVNTFYADSHVLHDVSFTLHEGRVLALLGRNGAGKTTCMHTAMGLLAPRDGEISLFGERIERLPPEIIARKGMALVPQGRRIFASLSVRENLIVAQHKRSGAAQSWTLERVFDLFPRLRERTQQAAGSLSGGEQQMLAIGRALMGNPRVLLMDEPSEGLAPLIVAEVKHTISRLKREGQSIVLVEQNAKLAFDLADDVVVLNTGRVAFSGSVAEVQDNEALLTQHLGVF